MFADLSGKKILLFVFLFPLAVYFLICTGKVVPEHPVTGDEPHYLIVTHSILFDRDIELTDNYFEKEDYRNFHPGDLVSGHYQKGKDGGRYPSHGLALSILLIPAYWAGMHFGEYGILLLCRMTMAVVLALLAAQIFLLARDRMGDRAGLLSGWIVASFTPPLVYYCGLFYPEIPAALCMIYPFRILSGENKPGNGRLSAAAVMLSLLPWWGIKYIPAQMVLLFFWLMVFKQNRYHWRGRLLFFPLLSLISLSLLFLFLQTVFGTVSPAALYLGVASQGVSQTEEFLDYFFRDMGHHLQYLVPTLLSYFIDQKVGLLFYSPVYILSLIGFFYFFRKDRLLASVLFLILSTHLLVYAYSSWVGGHSPPPRPLVSVSWIFAFFLIVFFVEERHRRYVQVKRFLTILSFGFSLIFLCHPGLLYHTLRGFNPGEKSRFLSQLESPLLPLTRMFPSLYNIAWNLMDWTLLLIWGILVLVFIWFCLNHVRKQHDIPMEPASEALLWSRRELFVYTLFIVCGFVFWKWAALVPLGQAKQYEGPMMHDVYFPDTDNCWVEEKGFWVKGDATTRAYLLTDFRISRLRLVMRGLKGNRLRYTIAGQTQDRAFGESNKIKVTIEHLEGKKWKGRYVYDLSFTSRGGWIPQKAYGGSDTRYLGFFVKMFPS